MQMFCPPVIRLLREPTIASQRSGCLSLCILVGCSARYCTGIFWVDTFDVQAADSKLVFGLYSWSWIDHTRSVSHFFSYKSWDYELDLIWIMNWIWSELWIEFNLNCELNLSLHYELSHFVFNIYVQVKCTILYPFVSYWCS